MLNDAKGFSRIIIACGRTDLRRGIDGLAAVVQEQFQLDPTEKNVLFLFCGTKTDRIKGLIFEGDGYLLVYKRLSADASVGHEPRKKPWLLRRSNLTC